MKKRQYPRRDGRRAENAIELPPVGLTKVSEENVLASEEGPFIRKATTVARSRVFQQDRHLRKLKAKR